MHRRAQRPRLSGGLLLLIDGTAFSWLFKLILNFIRSNIIYYIIKCKTYIIKISQHFTDHLIKISGAVPGGINLAKPQVLLLCSAVSVLRGRGSCSREGELFL